MPTKTLIKTCGIKQPDIAYAAAQAGADFIGLVFAANSKRVVNIVGAGKITDAARQGGAIPVAVFTDHTAEQMLDICHKANIDWVQLHGPQARAQHHLLPAHFHRLYVQSVVSDSQLDEQNALTTSTLEPNRDYLLFDTITPGSGKTFNWDNFSYTGSLPWFLSGGLTIDNVMEGITQLHPQGVDVSSGVENAAGEKDILLIKQFINTVKSEFTS